MTVVVKQLRPLTGAGNLLAFATVEVGPWTVRGCRVIKQPGQRPYVALPQEKSPDGRYFPVLQTKDRDLKNAIQAAVLREWGRDNEQKFLL